jgi:hypothetical protein
MSIADNRERGEGREYVRVRYRDISVARTNREYEKAAITRSK